MASTQAKVKVKVIETQFVETDTLHFKAVVQNLTGWNAKLPSENASRGTGHKGQDVGDAGQGGGSATMRGHGSPEELSWMEEMLRSSWA